MSRKIIFFDIDGTILSHRTNHISQSTYHAIKTAQTNGHLVFVNSGRTIAEIENDITQIGFDGYVCGCGTYISYHGHVLFHNTLPKDMIPILVQDFKNNQIEAIMEGSDSIYFDMNSKHPTIKRIWNDQLQHHDINIASFEICDKSVDKFCIWPTTKEGWTCFYSKYKEIFEFIDRKKNFYEVVPKGFSKATGIEYLLDYLNISHDNTYALGDGPNDLPMLSYVKHSIAMGNSDPDICHLVSFITEDVDKDGVACALKHYNII